MCTLTFVPHDNGSFTVTSNRDESPNRETLPPAVYNMSGIKLLYPKDTLAGGTWIGVTDKKRLIALLNGGFKAHIPHGDYRMSRGQVVLDLLLVSDFTRAVGNYNFDGIEPFTLVVFDWSDHPQLWELVWDGEAVHLSPIEIKARIWSASLLYSNPAKRKREQWFVDFRARNPDPTASQLLVFHSETGDGDMQSDLVNDRGFVRTKSISQVKVSNNITFSYWDLETDNRYETSLSVD